MGIFARNVTQHDSKREERTTHSVTKTMKKPLTNDTMSLYAASNEQKYLLYYNNNILIASTQLHLRLLTTTTTFELTKRIFET